MSVTSYSRDDALTAALGAATALTTQQLTTIEQLARRASHLGPSGEDAPIVRVFASYVPRGSETASLVRAFLDAVGVTSKVPLERMQLGPRGRRSLEIVVACDSPTYVAVRPRAARSRDGAFQARCGLTLLEGLSLVAQDPTVLDHHALDLVETVYSQECTPTLYRWNGHTYLSAIAPDSQDGMCRPLSVMSRMSMRIAELDDVDAVTMRMLRYWSKLKVPML